MHSEAFRLALYTAAVILLTLSSILQPAQGAITLEPGIAPIIPGAGGIIENVLSGYGIAEYSGIIYHATDAEQNATVGLIEYIPPTNITGATELTITVLVEMIENQNDFVYEPLNTAKLPPGFPGDPNPFTLLDLDNPDTLVFGYNILNSSVYDFTQLPRVGDAILNVTSFDSAYNSFYYVVRGKTNVTGMELFDPNQVFFTVTHLNNPILIRNITLFFNTPEPSSETPTPTPTPSPSPTPSPTPVPTPTFAPTISPPSNKSVSTPDDATTIIISVIAGFWIIVFVIVAIIALSRSATPPTNI